jgi:predicted phosphohydrolase
MRVQDNVEKLLLLFHFSYLRVEKTFSPHSLIKYILLFDDYIKFNPQSFN